MSDLEVTVLSAETVRADDALLDGQLTADPGSLRPVADALAALRAAPDPAELAREATARAAFRMFQPDEAAAGPLSRDLAPGQPARSHPPRRQRSRSQPARSQPPHRQRNRSQRNSGRRTGRGLAAALLGGAAAVVVALVLAFSLSGGSGQPASRLPDTHAVPPGGEQKVEGGAVIPTTPARPAGSAAASSAVPASPAAIPGCPHHGMHHRGCAGLSSAPGYSHR
jgi:hypothetical protein